MKGRQQKQLYQEGHFRRNKTDKQEAFPESVRENGQEAVTMTESFVEEH